MCSALHIEETRVGDVPRGPVVKTLSSKARSAGSILGWGPKIPHAAKCGKLKINKLKINKLKINK